MALDTGRSRLALVVLVVIFGALIYRAWPSGGDSPAPRGSGPGQPAAAAAAAPGEAGLDVRLEDLAVDGSALGDSTRNPFGFGAQPPAAPAASPLPPAAVPPGEIPPATPPVPAGPAPPPPIPLKFIGIVEAPDSALRVAVLSDGRFVYHGRVGEVIEGRYRIMRIGDESIEVEYVGGTGRQTIRLSGS